MAFPEYVPYKPDPPTPAPPTLANTCANYSCVNKAENCAHSHTEILKNSTNLFSIAVNLSDICNQNEYCNVGGSPNFVFYNGSDVTGTCKKYERPSLPVRYPGEVCSDNSQCLVGDGNATVLGKCNKGYCGGFNTTQSCNSTSECWVGNYCKEGICTKLKSANENCTKTNECKNNLLCYQKTCQIVWYSLNDKTNITGDGDYPAEYYCKFGKAFNGACDSMNTTDKIDDKTGLVSCNPAQSCNYTTNNGAFKMDCQCGYNKEGLAYCPKGHNQDTQKWYSLASYKAKKTNNNCHSESRALCYSEDDSYFASVKEYEHETETAHLFYGAPSCVIKVLTGSFLKVSFIFSFLTFAMMIL